MEGIRGKTTFKADSRALSRRLAGAQVLGDLGTGDGRYVLASARTFPDRFAIGIDACRENLVRSSRLAPPNALFLIANALDLPNGLEGLADVVTINFPWGSLLEGLLSGHAGVLNGMAKPGALLEMRLNAGALEEAGYGLEAGSARIRDVLRDAGFTHDLALPLDAASLRSVPSTWAKRLAFGRDPRGMLLRARRASAARSDGVGRKSCVRGIDLTLSDR